MLSIPVRKKTLQSHGLSRINVRHILNSFFLSAIHFSRRLFIARLLNGWLLIPMKQLKFQPLAFPPLSCLRHGAQRCKIADRKPFDCGFYFLLNLFYLFITFITSRGHCRVTEERWQKPNIGKEPHLLHVVLPTVKCCCHLLDDMIEYRFPHGKGVAAFSSQQHSLLSVFTAFPRNRCCCAEHRLELKLQNASGILTPMFPVYRIIFLCGAYCLAGGQEKLWTHFCVHVQGCL